MDEYNKIAHSADQDVIAKEEEVVTQSFQDPGSIVIGSQTFNDSFKTSTLDIEKFLSRPVQIINILSTDADTFYYPLELFLQNPAVDRVLTNYKGLSATLNLRIQQAGNPFLFGLNVWSILYITENMNTTLGSYSLGQNMSAFMDPSVSEPHEMKVPMVWIYDYLNLKADTAERRGVKHIILQRKTWSAYQAANTASTPSVGITIYAWLTDVKLVTATSDEIMLQSGEYTGVVSKPASIVSEVAGRLTDFPIIGTIARATQIGAKAVADVFSLFGMSKPHNINPPMAMYTEPNRGMYNMQGLDVANKLALDIKQENVISPEVISGSSVDPLSFKNIATRFGIILDGAYMTWNTSDVTGTIIRSIPVHPGMFRVISSNGMDFTPVCATVVPFKFWHGDLIYRLRLNCSQYHRGRLRVFWSPNPMNLPLTEDVSNIVESCIIDVSNDKVVDIHVPWASVEHFKTVNLEPATNQVDTSETDQYYASNGYLYFQVLQPLSAPIAGLIRMTLEVAAGDDFAVAVPTSYILEKLHTSVYNGTATMWAPPTYFTDLAYADIAVTDVYPNDYEIQSGEYSSPQPKEIRKCVLTSKIGDAKTHLERQFGECITSFRPMLKAYQPYAMHDNATQNVVIMDMIPRLTNNYSGETDLRLPTWLAYVSTFFWARRGGLRFKFQRIGSPDKMEIVGFRARTGVNARYAQQVTDSSYNILWQIMGLGLQGVAIGPNSLTVDVPYQLPIKFIPGCSPNAVESFNYITEDLNVAFDGAGYYTPTGGDMTLTYIAAAEDFTLDVFNGIPRFFLWDTKFPEGTVPPS